MQLKTFFVQDRFGNVQPGAKVYVYERGTQNLVSGLKDAAGQALSNPVVADAQGAVSIVADDGIYSVRTVSAMHDITVDMQFVDMHAAAQAALDGAERAAESANFVASHAGNIATVAGNISDLQLVAGNVGTVNVVAAGMTSIDEVARVMPDVAAAANQMLLASESSGPVFANTHAEMAGNSYPDGAVIEVLSDETQGGERARYTVSQGQLLGPVLVMDYTRRAILSAAGGAALMGFQQSRAGSVARNMRDKTAETVSILDFYLGADGADFGPAMIRAVAESNHVIWPEPPTGVNYAVKSNVSAVLHRDITIDFRGNQVTFDAGSITLSSPVVANGLTLSANADRGATTITLSSASEIQRGDLIYINTSIKPSSTWNDTKQDTVCVSSASGNTVTLDAGLNFHYTTADAGLNISVYRPRSVNLVDPVFNIIQTDGQTSPRRCMLIEGCSGVTIDGARFAGGRPFNRELNIYRRGIELHKCYGIKLNKTHAEAISYPFGIYAGSRNIIERDTTGRYNRHTNADVGNWSSDYTLDGLISDDCFQALNAHPCFRANARNFHVKNDYGLSNWRVCGGSLSDGYIQSSVDDTAELAQFQNIVPASGYQYINADADFDAHRIVFDTQNRVSKSPFAVRFGRDVRMSNVTAPSVEVGFSYGDVSSIDIGGGMRIGPRALPAPPSNMLRAPTRIHAPPIVNGVLSAGIYDVNFREAAVANSEGRIHAHGYIAKNIAGAATLPVRFHVQAFPGKAQANIINGTLLLRANVNHNSAGMFSSVEQKFNFSLKASSTSVLAFPLTPVFTSTQSGQQNESISMNVSNPQFAGASQVGVNGDHWIQIDVALSAGAVAAPVFGLAYEITFADAS